MGSLTFPSAGTVDVDSMVVIYLVDRHPVYLPACVRLWEAAGRKRVDLISSELVILETLVGPLRAGDAELASEREGFWTHTNGTLLGITLPVLREAARLRASIPALRTPDAIHAATALATGCAMFLTNDPVFKRIPGLPVTVLAEAVAAP